MAFEDVTLLGKRISQLNPIPQDWSEEQVVELITNGLIPLAKSNYDTFKTTLGFAFGYVPSWKNYSTKNGSSGGDNSIFIGKSTIIGNNSISLGDNNNGGNRVISLGFGNTNVDSGVCNFANIGYSNLIYNKVSEIRKYNDNDELELLPTQSFIAGVANKSRHYNDIIIGYGNESLQAESVEQGEPFNDDGFCIAIGFKNLIGRNYDIAIGHKSEANGGENIALQHSNAVGYRNLAMFGSNVNGTCNIASCDSNIDIYYPDNQGNKITNYVTYNIFHNSYVYHRRSENTSGEYSYNRNIILHASFKTESDCFQQNFIYGGYGLSDEGDESIFKSKLVSNNIALDTSMFKIEATTILKKNVFFQNNNIWANALTFYDNVFSLTNTNITSSKHIFRNNISHASIQGTVGLFHNNVIRNSEVQLSDNDINSDYSGFNFNVLLSNSSATFTREKNFWDGSRYYSMSSNFLFGANAQNTYGCFAMSDGVGLAIKNSNYTFVFGDNIIEQTTSCVVFGQNNIKRAINLTVFGRSNEIDCAYNDNTSSGSNVVSDGIVVGNRNTIKSYKKSYNTIGRLSVVGAGNSIICNNAHGIFITGDENKLQTITIIELTGAQIRQKQIDKEFVGHFKVNDFDVGYELDSNSGEVVDYSGYWWGAYDYYYYYDNGIIAQYNPSDITDAGYSAPTYTSITATNFINNLANGNVQDKTYWKISGSVDVPDNVHLVKGVFLIPTYSYGFYNNYGYYNLVKVNDNYNSADISYLNSYITISGENNVVSSNVNGYTVFGMSNKVKNTLVNVAESDRCISNGFVQGNNNDVSNGSNIIVMGNGNNAEGHNSVSIGMQLISKQWQTVIGKYNVSIDGPSRIIERFDSTKTYELGDKVINTNDNKYYEYISNASSSGSWVDSKWKEINPDDDKAIFIIGNGYSEKDNHSWQDEQYIHRSNAMVVYADGTIKAKNIITDEPLGKLVVNGSLVDAATINVPNNKLSTLQTQQSILTLVVDVESNDYAPNFLVEIEAQTNVTLTIKYTVNGSNLTTLPYNTDAGNTLTSGKKYQVSCCGHGWVLGELTQPTL